MFDTFNIQIGRPAINPFSTGHSRIYNYVQTLTKQWLYTASYTVQQKTVKGGKRPPLPINPEVAAVVEIRVILENLLEQANTPPPPPNITDIIESGVIMLPTKSKTLKCKVRSKSQLVRRKSCFSSTSYSRLLALAASSMMLQMKKKEREVTVTPPPSQKTEKHRGRKIGIIIVWNIG